MTSMADEGAPKSAYELAMERLKKKDADEGIERKPVTDAQKAEIRKVYEAKLAQSDVMHQDKMRMIMDSDARDVLDQEYRRERERLTSEREAKIEKVRRA